jgi:hypothetical protein
VTFCCRLVSREKVVQLLLLFFVVYPHDYCALVQQLASSFSYITTHPVEHDKENTNKQTNKKKKEEKETRLWHNTWWK